MRALPASRCQLFAFAFIWAIWELSHADWEFSLLSETSIAAYVRSRVVRRRASRLSQPATWSFRFYT